MLFRSQVVLVRLSGGRFEPRNITQGLRSNDYVEVLSGITEGEQVVTSANFLIDAESNLRAALSDLTPPEAGQSARTAVAYKAVGRLDAIDAKTGSVTVTHDPIPSSRFSGGRGNRANGSRPWLSRSSASCLSAFARPRSASSAAAFWASTAAATWAAEIGRAHV